MTSLATYQHLALDERVALSIRKHAARRLLAFEQGVDERASDWLTLLGCMKHEGSDARRPGMQGAVNATTASQGASDRPHVPDSHDARPGSKRVLERPYSEASFKRDVRTGRSPAARCDACVSYSVPTWALALPDEQRARLLTSAPRVFAQPSDERDERAPRVRQKANDERADRAARLRALAAVRDERHRA